MKFTELKQIVKEDLKKTALCIRTIKKRQKTY